MADGNTFMRHNAFDKMHFYENVDLQIWYKNFTAKRESGTERQYRNENSLGMTNEYIQSSSFVLCVCHIILLS